MSRYLEGVRCAVLEEDIVGLYRLSSAEDTAISTSYHEARYEPAWSGYRCSEPTCQAFVADEALMVAPHPDPRALWGEVHEAIRRDHRRLEVHHRARKGGVTEAFRKVSKAVDKVTRALAGRTDLEWLHDRVDEVCEEGRLWRSPGV